VPPGPGLLHSAPQLQGSKNACIMFFRQHKSFIWCFLVHWMASILLNRQTKLKCGSYPLSMPSAPDFTSIGDSTYHVGNLGLLS
jgi:hypothetical protein